MPPKPFRLFVHFASLENLPRSGFKRDQVEAFLVGLTHHADAGGDYKDIEPKSAREVWVSEVAGYLISWWIDSPAWEVKVVDIIPAPKK